MRNRATRFDPAVYQTQHRTLWWAATLDLLFSVSFGVNDRFTFFLPGAAFYALLGVAWVSRSYGVRPVARYATLALLSWRIR